MYMDSFVDGGDDAIGVGNANHRHMAPEQMFKSLVMLVHQKFIGDGSPLPIISGGGGGISMSGTTSNGVLTFNTSTQASVGEWFNFQWH